MPSTYAHHAFGVQTLPTLPADIRRPIQRYRELFDLGLQGPDFFFFYQPGKDTPVKKLGRKYHYQTGSEFFGRICRERNRPEEEELSYLYGLMGHYCLDSVCHPLIHQLSEEDSLIHNRVESEFDRYLMAQEGFRRPHFHDRGMYLKCSRHNCEIAARFYPDAKVHQVQEALRTMRLVLGLLTVHPAAKQVVRLMGGAYPGLLMENHADPACKAVNEQLQERFDTAMQRYPVCLRQLHGHMTFGEPFGEELEGIFG